MPLAVLAAAVLWGSVTIGPLTPVCRVGKPCDGPARHATLTFVRGTKTVAARTDASGRYRVVLTPGTWTVHASVGMRMSPATVGARIGTHRVNFSVDTGIR